MSRSIKYIIFTIKISRIDAPQSTIGSLSLLQVHIVQSNFVDLTGNGKAQQFNRSRGKTIDLQWLFLFQKAFSLSDNIFSLIFDESVHINELFFLNKN